MRAHVLQHVWFEDIGSMRGWLDARDAHIGYTRFFETGATLPAVDEVDLLIVMGGPMSVNDEWQYPWLHDERRFIGEAIRRDKPVLGICLGAQLIAGALGAKVYPNAVKEIGWLPVTAVDHNASNENGDIFRFPASTMVFHWHGETFDLPPGAVHLARSAACTHQAFQLGRNVIGLQFHLETTPATADLIIANCRDELIEGPWVQSEERIRAAAPSAYADINTLMDALLYHITGH